MIYCRNHFISLAKDRSMNRPARPGTGSYFSLYSANMSEVSWSIVPILKKSKIPEVKTESCSSKSCPMDSEGISISISIGSNMMMKST